MDRLEDGLLEMHDDSIDDSRSNTLDKAVGAAAMGELDAVAIAAVVMIMTRKLSDNDNPFGLATASNVNCGGVPDELRGLEVISEDVGERQITEIFLTNMLQLRVHLWACLVSFHHAGSAKYICGLQ